MAGGPGIFMDTFSYGIQGVGLRRSCGSWSAQAACSSVSSFQQNKTKADPVPGDLRGRVTSVRLPSQHLID